MARNEQRISRPARKKVINHLEGLGFSVKYFNEAPDEIKITQMGVQVWNDPIKVVSNDTGIEYDIFWGNQKGWDTQPEADETYRYFEESIKKDENGDLYLAKEGGWFVKNAQLSIVKRGKYTTALSDTEILNLETEEEFKGSINEFSSLEDFMSIDAPDYSVVYGTNPQVSVAQPIVNIQEITDSQFEKSKKLLEKQKQIWFETKEAERKGTIDTAMWTFDEIDTLYNSKCTSEDKRAFFIYLQNRAGKKLQGDWSEKYGSSYPAEAVDILELLRKGRLFVDLSAKRGERLQPRVIYRSGNIFRKHTALKNNKIEYIRRFGEEIYSLHEKELNDIFTEVWNNRLRVSGGDTSMYAKIVPISNIASEFRVNKIKNPKERTVEINKWETYTKFENGKLVQDIVNPKNLKTDANTITKTSLTLREAFLSWLKEAGEGREAMDIGVQYSNVTTSARHIQERYLSPIKNPYGKKEADRWEREKDDARKVGERLFSQFLQDGLDETDQVRLEFLWNSIYNNFIEPKNDEVPIGFTYRKFIGNNLFLLKKHNLNALRYYLTRGSVGLAYGVGIGKTFCSIFVMKQALDLGLAKRALVLVPNQVYAQFVNEIQRGLGKQFDAKQPTSRVNAFYNGQNEFNNSRANNAVDGINIGTYEVTPNLVFRESTENEPIDNSWMDYAVNILEMGSDDASPAIKEKWVEGYAESLFGRPSKKFDLDLETEMLDELGDEEELFPEGAEEEDEDYGGFGYGGRTRMFKQAGKVDDAPKAPKPIVPVFVNSPTTNYDFIVVDEAHNYNALFTRVLAPPEEILEAEDKNGDKKIKIKRQKNPFAMIRETSSGSASAMAQKLFFLTQYIQNKNRFGNTILLSATPFTNSPLQVFTMMTMLNYQTLRDMSMTYLKEFFDLFAKVEYADDITTDLRIVRRLKFIGWQNAVALQKLVYRYFDKSTREEEDEVADRPQKIVLPLKKMLINGKEYELAKENHVSCTIRMSQKQAELWGNVKKWAANELSYEDLFNDTTANTTIFGGYKARTTESVTTDNETDGTEIEVENPDEIADVSSEEGRKLSLGVRRLMCVAFGRQITLNPYLFKGAGYKTNPTPQEYVEASPKLLYVMECIKSVKKYHEENVASPYMSGQIIYMDFGIKAFPLIRQYLVDFLGFADYEVGIIAGSGNYIGKKKAKDKKTVQDAFLGKGIDEETGQETKIPESKRIKVLIGSQSIKEGINLQDRASVLYNCFLDFNPTDRIQLEGRIWRQGNEFANVRIVTPLIADCIDVFMFQKLEDKTERINQIWTRNGQIQELDTTSFDPSELKYELITDPIVLATLEREKRIEDLELLKAETSREYSSLITLKATWDAGDQALYPPLSRTTVRDFRFMIYYNISVIRPDLIDRPLLNKDNYLAWRDNYEKNEGSSQIQYDNIYSYLNNKRLNSENPYYFDRDFYYNNTKELDFVNSFFNYTAEQLIDLMVKVLKEQKVGYPLGYSKNWREVLASKVELPISQGDSVEFDTKKGRKQGVVDLAFDEYGNDTLKNFFTALPTYGADNMKVILEGNKIENKIDFSKIYNDLTPSEIKTLQDLFKKLLVKENDKFGIVHDTEGKIRSNYLAVTIDVGEIEGLGIEEKNVSKVKSKDTKVVEPTKYPEPFPYSNKDAEENIVDIIAYTIAIYRPLWESLKKTIGGEFRYLQRDFGANYMYLPRNEQPILFTEYIGGIFSTLMPNPSYSDYSYWDYGYFANDEKIKEVVKGNWKKTWIEVEERWINFSEADNFRGLFFGQYEFSRARKIVDWKTAKEKKFGALGIKTRTDLELLINESKTKLNGIDLQVTQLYDDQVFQEMVQEVTRKQEEIMGDELRFGNSFVKRAEQFANCNPEYLGNEMLAIFNNNPNKDTIKCGHVFTEADMISERKIGDEREAEIVVKDKKERKKRGETITEMEVIEEPVTEMTNEDRIALISEKIDALLEVLDAFDEGSDEYNSVMEKIDALKEAKEVYEI